MPGEFKGNRGEAQSYIPRLIEEGYTNTQIVQWMKFNEISYRNQSMYGDINRLRLEGINAGEIRGLDPDTPIPEKLMRTWHGDTEYAYRAVVKYDYFDTGTQTTGTAGTTLYFNHQPTEREVLEFFSDARSSIENRYNNIQEIYSATKIMYFRNEQ
jgi:hypothetical protein